MPRIHPSATSSPESPPAIEGESVAKTRPSITVETEHKNNVDFNSVDDKAIVADYALSEQFPFEKFFSQTFDHLFRLKQILSFGPELMSI